MLSRRSRPELLVLTAWVVWCAWVLVHYFAIPVDRSAWRDPGELFPPPFIREAVLRAGLGVASAALVTLGAWTAGALLLHRARNMFLSTIERVVLELAVGFAAVSFACLALALAGAYRPLVLIPLIIALALVGIVVAVLRTRRPCWPSHMRLSPGEGVMLACAVVACGFALTGALAPETEYDALWYHLWLPSRWLEVGHPVDVISEYVSLYPLTWELLFGAAMTLGGDVAAKLLHFECLLLVGVTTAMFASRWFPGASGVPSAALAITTPLMIWEGTTAYIDLALAWYVVVSVYALVTHDETRDSRWLILAALTMGTALAIKNLALIVLAIASVTLLVREAFRTTVAAALRTTALFVILAGLVPSPWYARAWLRSGNPVFPELYALFGAQPAERWDPLADRELRRFKERFGSGRSLPHLLALPWDVTVHGARFGGTLGPIFLLLLPPALIGIGRRKPGWRRVAVLSLGVFAYGTLWASPLSSFQLRFLVPVVPFLAVLSSEGLRRLPRVGWAITACLMLLNLPLFTGWHEADRRGWTGWLTHTMRAVPAPVLAGAESRDEYLARRVPSYRAWQYIDQHAGAGARVLTFTGGDHFYSRTERISSEAPIARAATWDARAGQEANSLAALSRLGITHVLFSKRQFQDPGIRELAVSSAEMRACCLVAVYDDGGFAVYRVR